MKNENLVPAEDFCLHHNIEYSFISSLGESGIINVTSVQKSTFLEVDDLGKLEKFIRLHYDLQINLEGLETINHLLEKIENMQEELRLLQNRM